MGKRFSYIAFNIQVYKYQFSIINMYRLIDFFILQLDEHNAEFHSDVENQTFAEPTNNENTIIQCDILPLFELGSCHYDFYLVNIRIPVDDQSGMNVNLPKITDLHMVVSIIIRLIDTYKLR